MSHVVPLQYIICQGTAVTATDEIPKGYDHSNQSGEAKIFYDDKGNPAKAEIDTMVIDLAAEGNFQGVTPQSGPKQLIEDRVKRSRRTLPSK